MITPQQAAAKWSANLAAATTAIKAGVQAVTQSPTAAAAGRIDAYVAGVQRAVASGKMQAALNGVSLQQWQNAMITKGVPRVATGAAAAQDKMVAFMSKWLPYEGQLQGILAGMPRGTLDQNIARAVATIQHNAAYKG